MISSGSPVPLSVLSARCKRLRFLRERTGIKGETVAWFRDVKILTKLLRKLLTVCFSCAEEPLEFLFAQV